MPIVIQKVNGQYVGDVTPPHGGGVPWSAAEPMSRDALIAALVARGCHQTDIGDAFYEADPGWLDRE
jgi:hypothetical protein